MTHVSLMMYGIWNYIPAKGMIPECPGAVLYGHAHEGLDMLICTAIQRHMGMSMH